MCGIAGRFSPEEALSNADRLEVEQITERLRHRGPDDGGIADHGPLAVLGHRRLSIIDLAQGHQPMASADGALWITYNGEVYNYRTLRSELEGRGHSFRTQSDTEVVLAAYAEWGEQCVERLEGMFAFAMLDLRERRLFLARDHVGKKPLYVRWRNGILDFASELSALRDTSDWSGETDPVAWAFFLRLGYVPAPWTIYRGVEKLRPGESWTIDRRGIRKRRFWKISSLEGKDPRDNDEEILAELEQRLEQAVEMRLMSEVPLGAFLSGGIDSGLVVSLMARLLGAGVKTTTVGFRGEAGGGELGAAQLVARHNRTDHEELMVEPEGAASLERIVTHFGEPFADASAIPTWYISRETRRRVTVALSGDGGDEAWGGYDFRYLPHRRDARLRQAVPGFLRRSLFGELAARWPHGRSVPRPLQLRTVFRNLSVEEDEAYYLDLCFMRPEAASALAPDLDPWAEEVSEYVRGIYRECRCPDPLDSIMRADATFYMPEDVLVKVDRMSMAHGLEVRSPFLSKRIIELAFSLPSTVKIRGRTTKLALRGLAGRLLPPSLSGLPKRGFHAPIDAWFRSSLRPVFEAEVLAGAAPPWADPRALAQTWNTHQSGERNLGFDLWALLVASAWSRESARGGAEPASAVGP